MGGVRGATPLCSSPQCNSSHLTGGLAAALQHGKGMWRQRQPCPLRNSKIPCPLCSHFPPPPSLPGQVERLEDDLAELVDILNARPGVPRLRRPAPGSLKRFNYNAGSCDEPAAASDDEAQQPAQQQPQQEPQPQQPVQQRPHRRQLYADAAGEQSSSSSSGGSSSKKALPPWAVPEQWEPRNGTANLCDKNLMLQGRYQPCYAAFASFYAEDLRLLLGLP